LAAAVVMLLVFAAAALAFRALGFRV
jgi:hypothetical protein